MDAKFRLAFASIGATPRAEAYAADGALIFDRLRDAVTASRDRNPGGEAPFISHRFMVLDPVTIDVLFREFVVAT